MMDKHKRITNLLKSNKTLIENFSYISILQVFILLTPLITYPYLTRVLGTELYGLVITAQILSSYATIVVKFGFDSVSARYISLWREDKSKMSEVMSSILTTRFLLWFVSFILYITIVLIIPIYREHLRLFIYSFGLTLNVLLFPQFFFQGVEKMKYITFINIGIQVVFIMLIFLIIRTSDNYEIVPLLHSIGYLIGGVSSLCIIYKGYHLKYKIPSRKQVSFYFKDAFPLFATDAVCTIKDKLGYLLLGGYVGMSDVVVYDVGSKLTSLAVQPLTIINTVIFPRMAKNQNNGHYRKIGFFVFGAILFIVVLINLFLHPIVFFLLGKEVPLIPIRLFLLSPIFLGVGSYIGSCLIVARGYNKYMFYSILVTTSAYILSLVIVFISGNYNKVSSFIAITVIAYLVEMLYRLIVSQKILKKSQTTTLD